MKSTIVIALAFLVLFFAKTDSPLQAAESSTMASRSCGVSFTYPASLRVESRPPTMENVVCEFLVASAQNAFDVLTITVVASPLPEALILGGWDKEGDGNEERWVFRAYTYDEGKPKKVGDRTVITAEAAYNCGGGRGPGMAVACDALQGAVSNGRLSVLINTNLSGLTDAALQITNSMSFLKVSGRTHR